MHWGHKVASKDGPVEVTRLEYNQQAGVESPAQPEIPLCAAHVYDWWWELNSRRMPGFDSLAPLSYTEISHWVVLTGKIVSPEEIRWLIRMDNAWLEVISTERKARQERDKEEAERNKGKGGKRKR